MTTLGSDPRVDQLMAAVAEAGRGRSGNAHLYEDELIGAKVDWIFTECGPAWGSVDLRKIEDDRNRTPIDTGLAGAWSLRWVGRPALAYTVWTGKLDAVLDQVVPLRGMTRCDRCDRDVPPRWILLVPTTPSHIVLLVCEACHDYLALNFKPVRFDAYVD